MGAKYPRGWSDPRMNPESAKRKRSGFWDYRYDMETQTETWVCDKRKLNDALARAMLDREFSHKFNNQGIGILDGLFGAGTAEAFRHSGNRVAMRLNPFDKHMGMDQARGRDQMALGYETYANMSGTSTTTSGTSTSSFTTTDASVLSGNQFIRDEMKRQINETVKKIVPRGTRRLVKNVPFKMYKPKTLLEQLQQDFDGWAGSQMRLVGSHR